MKVVKQANLIYSDVKSNHNKFYKLFLYDDGTLKSCNGRVGVTEVLNDLPKLRGESDFEKQLRAKLKKGYTELKTVSSNEEGKVVNVAKSDLSSIARSQIKTNKPELEKLIDRLVQANIHTITSSTSIKYNDATGLFTTPLGIVTPEGVKEARDLLLNIKTHINKSDYSSAKFINSINSYLRLIPQNLGMKKPDPKVLFPDDTAIQQQGSILDSLEASYLALNNTPATPTNNDPIEKVFDVSLELLEDSKEFDRIDRFYRSTAKSMHVSYKLKINSIYKLSLSEMVKAFEIGKKCGNIKELWHGTKKANLLSILKCGLKVSPPSTAAIAGKLFGNGVYFSDQSTKSLNYAYGYWDGKYEKDCFMLLNDVAMGKEYNPKTTYESLPKQGYDSTFAIGGQCSVQNNEMIVYNNNQINIKYLVEFKE